MSGSPMASTWRTDSRAVKLHKSVRVTVGSLVTNLIPTAIVAFFVYTLAPGAAVGRALMYIGIPLGGLIFLGAIGGAVVALIVAYNERRARGESGGNVAGRGGSGGARVPLARIWLLLVVTLAVTASRIVANWWFFSTNGAGSAARTEVGPGPVVLTSWILYIVATVTAFWTFFGVRRYEKAVTPEAEVAVPGSEPDAS
ncbi:hypothetical protein QP228_000950 [Pseudoglutamicibacter cumminsii]|uniref:hypothetical protein n=1 Tax=Pseudoglutamicibacter cumminsii TaxID=156979 RepID=UPI002ABB0620|nr:hypothetical protein [Pseudoglutamicibacter cumminsii]MDZ3744597.1 hypothetical protein [Pseudoglutamicibacter cumminsii]